MTDQSPLGARKASVGILTQPSAIPPPERSRSLRLRTCLRRKGRRGRARGTRLRRRRSTGQRFAGDRVLHCRQPMAGSLRAPQCPSILGTPTGTMRKIESDLAPALGRGLT